MAGPGGCSGRHCEGGGVPSGGCPSGGALRTGAGEAHPAEPDLPICKRLMQQKTMVFFAHERRAGNVFCGWCR